MDERMMRLDTFALGDFHRFQRDVLAAPFRGRFSSMWTDPREAQALTGSGYGSRSVANRGPDLCAAHAGALFAARRLWYAALPTPAPRPGSGRNK